MAAELILAPEVEFDLAEAYAWYEARRVGLGEEFLTSVDACLESIRRQPQIYTLVYETYRRALIRRFPFAVFYEYADAAVTVYAVFHTSRDPEKWRQRLR
ncbi:MAG: type II toxin-antitoxin system RelE/ParE family toxin [Bryobacteraceae bacterium]